MPRRVLQMGAAVVLALAFTACSSSSSNKSSSSTATTAGGGATATTAGGGGALPGSGETVKVTVSDTQGLNAKMTLVAAPATAKAGNVTFTVTNKGTIDHEVVVLKLSGTETFSGLPITTVDGESDRVNEDANVGETGDPALKPGETRSFTVKNMAAGRYALVCNISKHYGLGMRAPFVVT